MIFTDPCEIMRGLKMAVDANMNEFDELVLETAAFDGNLSVIQDAVATKALLTDTQLVARLVAVALLQGNYIIVDYLCLQGIDLNKPSKHGVTPLEAAAWNADPKAIRYLLERGGTVNQPGSLGSSLLFYAMDGELEEAYADLGPHDRSAPAAKADATEVLLEYGADTELKHGKGETALEFAIRRRHKKAEQAIRNAKLGLFKPR